MKTGPPKIILWCTPILVVAFIVFVYYSNEMELIEYTTRNQDEKEIVAVLMQYQEAKNRYDIDQFLVCLHEQGRYSFKGISMVSKEYLKHSFPTFWATLQSSDRIVLYPLSHEFVTGDYFVSGRLINPQILITGDAARVTVTFASGWWRQKHYIFLLRVDDAWMINRLEWEEA